jgi:hypothetical protein
MLSWRPLDHLPLVLPNHLRGIAKDIGGFLERGSPFQQPRRQRIAEAMGMRVFDARLFEHGRQSPLCNSH